MKNKKVKLTNISKYICSIKLNYKPFTLKPKEDKIIEVGFKDVLQFNKDLIKLEDLEVAEVKNNTTSKKEKEVKKDSEEITIEVKEETKKDENVIEPAQIPEEKEVKKRGRRKK
jgi:hypothetical protein